MAKMWQSVQFTTYNLHEEGTCICHAYLNVLVIIFPMPRKWKPQKKASHGDGDDIECCFEEAFEDVVSTHCGGCGNPLAHGSHAIVLFATAQCMHGVGIPWRRLMGKWGVKWQRDMGFCMCANHALMPMPTCAVAVGLMENLMLSFIFISFSSSPL